MTIERATTIWKYPLEITDEQRLKVPSVFRPLSVGFQWDGEHHVVPELMLWAAVNPESIEVERTVVIYGTGNPFYDLTAQEFVGTVHDPRGYVWHVFVLDAMWDPTTNVEAQVESWSQEAHDVR